MTAKVSAPGEAPSEEALHLDAYDQELMTAVVQRAEKAGKEVKPLIVPTNNPLYAVLRTAKELGVHELVMGASNKYTADEQLEGIAFYWMTLHDGKPAPLTIRVIGKDRDVQVDLGGGFHIPKMGERRARSVEELRAAGIGADRVLLVHDDGPAGLDLFQAVLTMLDPKVVLTLASPAASSGNGTGVAAFVQEQAKRVGRDVQVLRLNADPGAEIVRLAHEGQYDAIILPLPPDLPDGRALTLEPWTQQVLARAHCRVFLVASPRPPQEVVDKE
jgi:nucleotide-binding universal stress UspA family protein